MADPTRGWKTRLNRNDLEEANAPSEPFTLFDSWFADACNADLIEPTAMTLATVDEAGQPSARTVLLKGFDERGFCFYTNYQSHKAEQLVGNPRAALVFWWDKLERQVRIRGVVKKLDAATSDAYFATRPRDSQIGAHASHQSRPIASRAELQRRVEDIAARFSEVEIPRPDDWGGYRLVPEAIEFWQGRAGRLHDRLLYIRDGDRWQRERLAP